MGGSSAVEKRVDDRQSGHKDQLGGARADFVANLGRRRAEITGALDLLRDSPASSRHRDDLRRRIHALAAGARLLRFTALSEELRMVEEQLERTTAEHGTLSMAELDYVAEVLSRMTRLAWGEGASRQVVSLGATESVAALR